ncbi:tRNA pseudouridine(13) synthase TruD [Halothiobacillus sp.]|uniref:tRNA pseudouridine(13) synthase TruD n=1 Tax=Halothiobacillus sp. TaxID=1891311 RepID=UPI002611046D|nr:tRNA pseudouridine(13) synthase TruD [Halothiobacillus sp.]
MSISSGPLNQLSYRGAPPILKGQLKQSPADFRVDEILGFEPDGEGTHGLFLIEKTGITTGHMLGLLSKLSGVAERDIGFCGMKDKLAVTTQWVSLPLAASHSSENPPDWIDALPDHVVVLRWNLHRKKLRRGNHRGNRFSITIRNVIGDDPEFVQRLDRLEEQGFPNYFAEQRFGHAGGNYALLEKLGRLSNARSISRADRNWGISTLRAEIFNRVLSDRLSRSTEATAESGDLARLAGTNSWFLVADEELNNAQQRIDIKDIWLTGPLWGEGASPAGECVQAEENRIAAEVLSRYGAENWSSHLHDWRVDHDRRALMAPVTGLQCEEKTEEGGRILNLSFELESGSYATALLREIIELTQT